MTAEFKVESPIQSSHSGPFRFILSHIMRHPVTALLLILGAFSNAFLAGVVPGALGDAFNAILLNNEMTITLVLNSVLLIIVSQALRSALQFVRNFAAEVFAQRFERDIRDELYASLLGKSMSYHDMQPVGETMARVTNDVREMNLMMNPGFNLITGANMFLIMPAIYAPAILPELVITPLFFIVSHILVQIYFVVRLHPIAQEVRAGFGGMNAKLAESLEGLEVVKGAAQEESEIRDFNRLADRVRDRFIDQGEFEARYLSLLLFGLTDSRRAAAFRLALSQRRNFRRRRHRLSGACQSLPVPGLHLALYVVAAGQRLRQRRAHPGSAGDEQQAGSKRAGLRRGHPRGHSV